MCKVQNKYHHSGRGSIALWGPWEGGICFALLYLVSDKTLGLVYLIRLDYAMNPHSSNSPPIGLTGWLPLYPQG